MVKIEKISPGAAVSFVRNGVRQNAIEKQLITYEEADTLEVTGGEVTYSVNETEVITKSGNPAPTIPQAAKEPELATPKEAPVIVKPAVKTAAKK
jgi:hypothetical protein